ncbi:MAG: carboxypeptidase M32 [Planctomycetaceae bacterium]
MDHMPQAYQELVQELQSIAVLRSCASVLSWDEQTYLPPEAAEYRAEQLSLLAGMSHDRATSPKIGEWLEQLTDESALGESDSVAAANVREAKRGYERSTKLPKRLVEELSRVGTLSQQAWITARKNDDYETFKPWLTKMIALKREEAAALGSESGLAYDALLDDYEPGATTEIVSQAFQQLREQLVELVAAIRDSGVEPQHEILTRRYPIETQRILGLRAAKAIGFSFESGRLDVSAHPMCCTLGPRDCRLTTRYDEKHFPGAFFGTLHEAGHGIYEQGLDSSAYGLASGEACSLGIHESQSRMWENLVGRSMAFWEHFYPETQQLFPEALSDVDLTTFYAAINDVRPSWIRVEADEVTYNLHIMLRFEIEQALIAGDLSAEELPDVWNKTFYSYFGMTPPTHALGCLQDVHWSIGLFGYFPTYALGNMYASQIFQQAGAELGDLPTMFSKGEFAPLKEWLNKNVHAHGRCYRAPQLVEKITGTPFSAEPLVNHLRSKFGPLYGLG